MKQGYGIWMKAALMAALIGFGGCKQEKADLAGNVESKEVVEQSAAASVEQSEPDTSEIKAQQVETSPVDLIKNNLMSNLPQLQVVQVLPSSAEGIYQVEINNGEVIHVTADGQHIINGDMLVVKAGGVENVTEAWRSEKRIAALAELKDENLVVFQAEGEEKGEVIAFTDTSCGYCQKMHLEIPQLNAMGITVKYAAWPRYGLQSPAGQTMANIWCSADRQEAMTLGKTRKPVPKPEGDCDVSAINDQIALGRTLGVRGTPAVFLSDGRKVGGYRPAADLAAEFGVGPKAVPVNPQAANTQ
ncbi:MAG: DsbC family protein [Pseudomonadales bacterium]|nr:DsbC family protein [Pseudomonadales bacterium]